MKNFRFFTRPCYIGNCSAIPYIAKKALRATDAHSRDWKMSLTRPRSARAFRRRNAFLLRNKNRMVIIRVKDNISIKL